MFYRDGLIQEERKLRQDAEDKFKKILVDLYKDPGVNKELRSRLPYSKEQDLFFAEKEGLKNIEPMNIDSILSSNRERIFESESARLEK